MQTRRAVILTSLEASYMAVRAHLTDLKEAVHRSGTVYQRGAFWVNNQKWEVSIVEIGQGNPESALETERAIQHFNPSIAFLVGVAGGIKDVKLGDVVAATEVYGYESGKVKEGFQVRPKVGNCAYALVQRARNERHNNDWLKRILSKNKNNPKAPPRVFVGPIAAGEKVVASKQSLLSEFIHLHYNDALAIEMEGHGFLKATLANQQVKALIVRGISNLIENKNESEVAGWREIASRHASAFAFEVLAKWGISSNYIMSDEINTTNTATLLDELEEWKHIHDVIQSLLNKLKNVLTYLNKYKLIEDEESLDQAGLHWQEGCARPLKLMFQKRKLEHAYTLEFDELKEKIDEIKSITQQIMGDVNRQQFRNLYSWFIDLNSLLWDILTVANKRIVVLVDRLRSPVRR